MRPLSREAAFQLRRAERVLREREERRARMRGLAMVAARTLHDEFGARAVWLFGSLQRPWFHESSDIDLAVTGVAPDQIGRAWDRLTELLDERVDLVAMEEAEEGLRQRILATGERLDEELP